MPIEGVPAYRGHHDNDHNESLAERAVGSAVRACFALHAQSVDPAKGATAAAAQVGYDFGLVGCRERAGAQRGRQQNVRSTPCTETYAMISFGSQNQRRWSPGSNTPRNSGHEVGQQQRTECDQDYRDNGDSRGGDRIDLLGKQVPKRPDR